MSHTVCIIQDMAHSSESGGELVESLRLELHRGSLALAVMSALQGEQYGYTLRNSLSERGTEIDEGALYPLLCRLESQGLLTSQWREKDRRKKRFYRLSSEGKRTLKLLLAEWLLMNSSLKQILQEYSDGPC